MDIGAHTRARDGGLARDRARPGAGAPRSPPSFTPTSSDRLPGWNRAGSEAAPPGPLAEKVLEAVEHDRRAVYYPRSVRLLGIAHGVSPKLADRLLRALRGGTAAQRAD